VRKKEKLNTFCCFIDFRKAYDKVWRRDLFACLWKIGIRGRMLDAIKKMYESVSSRVCVKGMLTESFSYEVGLRQGCILSPLLFCIWINDMANTMNEKNTKIGIDLQVDVKINGILMHHKHMLKMLLYADDLVLLAENAVDLQYLMNHLAQLVEMHRCEINEKKTKVVVFGREGNSVQYSERMWVIGDKKIDVASEYKYLGIWFDESMSFKRTINERENKCLGAIALLRKMGHVHGTAPIKTSMKVLYAKVLGIMEYGSVVWSTVMKRVEWERLEVRMREALRAILGLRSGRGVNVVIHGDLGIPTFEGIIRKRRVMWWRELVEMSDTRLCKLIYRWGRCKESAWWDLTNAVQHSINPQRKEWTKAEWARGWFGNEEKKWLAEVDVKCEKRKDEVSKIKLYGNFKKTLRAEAYLENEDGRDMRSKMVELRGGGCVELEVERCSMSIPARGMVFKERNERLCRYCVVPHVEDVSHFLGICSKWQKLRGEVEKLFQQIIEEGRDTYARDQDDGVQSLVIAMLGGGCILKAASERKTEWFKAVALFLRRVFVCKARDVKKIAKLGLDGKI